MEERFPRMSLVRLSFLLEKKKVHCIRRWGAGGLVIPRKKGLYARICRHHQSYSMYSLMKNDFENEPHT